MSKRKAVADTPEFDGKAVAALDDKTEAVTNAESNQLEVCFYGRLYV